MPIVAITGGAIGALVLGSITAVTPRLGATVTYLCFVAGITVSSVLLDQFGILDLPQQSLTLWRAVGIALILSGVAVVRLM
jgi:transporter family-2 protein